MRIDVFLHRTGLIRRRTKAQRACGQGRVQINGRSIKAAASVSVGQKVTVFAGCNEDEWKIVGLPPGTMPRDRQAKFASLISRKPWTPPEEEEIW